MTTYIFTLTKDELDVIIASLLAVDRRAFKFDGAQELVTKLKNIRD